MSIVSRAAGALVMMLLACKEPVEDKIAPADWGRHLGRSSSSLVNASTWAGLRSVLTVRILSGLAVSTSQVWMLFSPLRAGVTALMQPPQLILVLNFRIGMTENYG